MTLYVPRIERSGSEFTISTAFSGSDGATNRTYTLGFANAVLEGMSVIVSGSILQPNVSPGFTYTSGVITFTGVIYNSFDITLNYNTESSYSTSTGDTSYATTEELSEFMVMISEIPNPTIKSDSRVLELLGVGTGSTQILDVDHAFILANSYTVYYGASETAALSQPLTETTHFTLDKDMGKITITTAGATLVSTANIYMAYKYNNIGFKDSALQDELNRAGRRINKDTRAYWVDGTADTPDWQVATDETHVGRGASNRAYFLKNRPLPDVSTTLTSSATVGDTTLSVSSTDGFPSSGYVGIGSEKITYSAKTDTTFTCTATTVAHTKADVVLPYVFEASNTLEGSSPTWTVLSQGDDYYLDLTTGRVYFSAQGLNVTDAQAYDLNPPRSIPERFRGSYIWGFDEITYDIKRLCLMIASEDLLHRAVRKAHASGLNDFNPAIVNIDREYIDKVIKSYKQAPMGTTI